MTVSLTMVGDVDPRPRKILLVYSLFKLLLEKDVLDLVGVVLNKTNLAAVYNWSGVFFCIRRFLFPPVSPMDLGFVTVTWDKGPVINRWISLKLRWNNDMEVMTLVGSA